MKKILILLISVLLLSSCAQVHNEPTPEEIHGFWFGLWNGFTAPVSFIASLFSDEITVWETHNNGNWYTFGFLWGSGIITFFSSKSKSE